MKRRLTKLVVFLLLGAIVNVAVAWGCAAWPRQAVILVGNEPRVLLAEDVAWWNAHIRPQFGCDFGYEYLTRDHGVQGRILFGPSASGSTVVAIRLSSGWPARTLAGDVWKVINTRGLFPQWESAGALIDSMIGFMLPLRPIWPGFAINTAFYAVILWLLTLSTFAARRHLRRKRGHCIKCGYDLSHAEHEACPECGHELRSAVMP